MIIKALGTEVFYSRTLQSSWYKNCCGTFEASYCYHPKLYRDCANRVHELRNRGVIDESQFEIDCLTAVLKDVGSKKLCVIELGAGFGRMCLYIKGILTSLNRDKDYYCKAVEAEPTHYKWCKQHFDYNHIPGEVIFAAVSNKMGYIRFDIGQPSKHYGKGITTGIRGLANYALGRTLLVPTITLDSLLDTDVCTLIIMDIQGAESQVLQSCKKLQQIDYLLIGTHKDSYYSEIPNILGKTHEIIVDILPNSEDTVEGVGVVACQDGLILAEKRLRTAAQRCGM